MLQRVSRRQTNFWLMLIAFAVAILVPWPAARAATLQISGASTHVAAGEQYAATVYIDTGNDNINAITGVLLIPSEFAVQAIRYGDSVVDFWVQSPTVATSTASDGVIRIKFSGVMSGGISTNQGALFSVVLAPTGAASGETATLSFDKVIVLKSDGLGTAASTALGSLNITIAPPPVNQVPASLDSIFMPDTTPPEQFTPAVARNKALFNNKYFVVFLTQDSGSGVDHYEVQESSRPEPGSAWIIAASPYLLQNQKRTGYIFVKAVDRSGNVRSVVVLPIKQSLSYQKYLLWCIIGAVVLALLVLFIKRRRHTRDILPPRAIS